MGKRILFSDLDSTLIEPIGKGKLWSVEIDDWVWKTDILSALVNYNPDVLHIVTNRGDIKEGKQSKDTFDTKIKLIIDKLKETLPDTEISYDYSMALEDDRDFYRKPNCGMLVRYFEKHGISRFNVNNDVLMIGDGSLNSSNEYIRGVDELCALNFGCDYLDINDFIKKFK